MTYTATPTNTQDIKKVNRNRIYMNIFRHDNCTRPELALRLGMSLPTVIHNVKSLIEAGLVEETGMLESTGGRRAATLSVAPGARVSLGIDITQNHLALAVVDLKGTIIRNERVKFRFAPGRNYLDRIASLVESSLAAIEPRCRNVLGAGISFPGIIFADGVSAESHILSQTQYRLDDIARRLGMFCVYTNDANAAAIAETWASPDVRDFIYLSLSNSVGGAVVWNGSPVPGKNNRCGEVGHMTLHPGGTPCYCGKKGCLDAYCSAEVLSRSLQTDLADFFTREQSGDKAAAGLLKRYLDDLATAINSLRMVFDYDIVIGGFVGAFMDKNIDDLRRRVERLNTFGDPGAFVHVCRHKNEASAVGAALILVQKYLTSI